MNQHTISNKSVIYTFVVGGTLSQNTVFNSFSIIIGNRLHVSDNKNA